MFALVFALPLHLSSQTVCELSLSCLSFLLVYKGVDTALKVGRALTMGSR